MRLNIVKRTVMATALAVATTVVGIAGQAQAFSFGEGDLVLAIYGNNTEALVDLGNANTILAPGGQASRISIYRQYWPLRGSARIP